MTRAKPRRTFEEWILYYFDRPSGTPEWYWNVDEGLWNPDPATYLEWTTRLFQDCRSLLAPYSDDQCGLGLKPHVDGAISGACRNWFQPALPWEAVSEAIESVEFVFRDTFAPRLASELAQRADGSLGPLRYLAYMWWDVFPFHADGPIPRSTRVTDGIVEVCGRILEIPHDACREGALHGLGHFRCRRTASRVEEIVTGWLRRNPGVRKDLRDYANAARRGGVE